MGFYADVWEVVRRIPPGQVRSYGEVAEAAGGLRHRHGKAAGQAMARCPRDVPWWRVIRGDGTLAPHLRREQSRRLAAEGVVVDAEGRVVGKRFGERP